MRHLRLLYHSFKSFFGVNWIKTLYFNFRMFDFATACKLPVYFYGPVSFQNLSGKIKINAPIKRAMIGFGQQYEKNTRYKGIGEIALAGTIIFKGNAQISKDCFIYVGIGAIAEFGHMAGIAGDSKFICTQKIVFGKYVRTGSECFISDTDFHPMVNTLTNEKYPVTKPIILGNYNYISTRVTLFKGTVTPDYCTVASNSLCNKDYTSLGTNILIGGVPAKLLRSNITRDWEGERELMDKWMDV